MCRAGRGVSSALYPKSAIAGSIACLRVLSGGVCPRRKVLRAGSEATEAREPRQVREEAAVSGSVRVTWGCPV